MERPSMNPIFMDGLAGPPRKRSFLGRVGRAVVWAGSLLVADVAFWRRNRVRDETGSALWRLCQGLFYRLIFAPVLVLAVVVGLVYVGTHPERVPNAMDPQSVGLYFENAELASADGTKLEAWVVPMLDPKRIAQRKEQALRERHPAVVLVHGHGQGRSQMLPLLRPLHEAGYVLVLPATRGTAGTRAAATFGLKEADDVQAAVDLLRRRADVDPRRVAVLGVGTGANAALIAASRDQNIAALVLEHPATSGEQVVLDHLGPPQPWLAPLRPLCRWTFEALNRVDVDELQPDRYAKVTQGRPVLKFDSPDVASGFRPVGQMRVREFLAKALEPKPAEQAGGAATGQPTASVLDAGR